MRTGGQGNRQPDGARRVTSIALQTSHYRLVLVAAAITIVAGLLVLARGAPFPFILGGILAYVLFPVVKTLESWMPWRTRWPNASRIAAILAIYVSVLAALAGALAIVIPPAFDEAHEFIDTAPELFSRARTSVEGWSEQYTERIPEDLRQKIEQTLGNSGSILIQAAQTVIASEAAGLWGMVVAVPLAAVGRDVFKYSYREWSQETTVPRRGQELDEPAALQEPGPAVGDAADSSVPR